MADERQKPPSSAHHDADSISASSATTSVSRGIAPRRARAADRGVERVVALEVAQEAESAWTIKSSASALRTYPWSRVEAEEHVRDQQREYRHDQHRQGAESQVALVQFRLRREPQELQLALAVAQRERGQIEI